MGADNWATCPKCWHQAVEASKAEHAAVMASYGQVTVEQFDAARAALKDPDPEQYRTLREDYEWGADTWSNPPSVAIYGRYSCGCTVCDLSGSYAVDEPLWSPANQEGGA